MGKSSLNKFFNKIFIINLFDRKDRWDKVIKQFEKNKIEAERFIAVDGRCKNQGRQGCIQKLKNFEMIYNVRIPIRKNMKIEELVPAASLTIGTILILRAMVRHKWKRILICEDDIEFTRGMVKKFEQGVKELKNTKWDLLYLGCGNTCGNNGISLTKTSSAKHKTSLHDFYPDMDHYVSHPNDLRKPCPDCRKFSPHISYVSNVGGGWCYSYSLSGAKKILKLIDNNVAEHIDQITGRLTRQGKLKTLAFDPPIVMHMSIRGGRDTDIPWKM